jgi:transposase-like protein
MTVSRKRRRFPPQIIAHAVWLCFRFPLSLRLVEDMPLERGIVGSYAAARRKLMPGLEHRSRKGLNNRAENSHAPLRKREGVMQGFRSWRGLQRSIEIFSAVRTLFVPPRPSHQSAVAIHLHRMRAIAEWKSATFPA